MARTDRGIIGFDPDHPTGERLIGADDPGTDTAPDYSTSDGDDACSEGCDVTGDPDYANDPDYTGSDPGMDPSADDPVSGSGGESGYSYRSSSEPGNSDSAPSDETTPDPSTFGDDGCADPERC